MRYLSIFLLIVFLIILAGCKSLEVSATEIPIVTISEDAGFYPDNERHGICPCCGGEWVTIGG